MVRNQELHSNVQVRASTYTYVPYISVKKALFGPGPFQTFVSHVSLSTGQLQSLYDEKKNSRWTLSSLDGMESEGGDEEGEDDLCVQHVWLQTTFLTDESDDEDDEDVV